MNLHLFLYNGERNGIFSVPISATSNVHLLQSLLCDWKTQSVFSGHVVRYTLSPCLTSTHLEVQDDQSKSGPSFDRPDRRIGSHCFLYLMANISCIISMVAADLLNKIPLGVSLNTATQVCPGHLITIHDGYL
jgi:hypothetical protein